MTLGEYEHFRPEYHQYLDAAEELILSDPILKQRRVDLGSPGDLIEIPRSGEALFAEIWDICFGADGYLNAQPPEKIIDDKQILARGYILAEYAHQYQKRGTGEAYVEHPLRIVLEISKDGHQFRADRIASALDHDIKEDSKKNGFPVELEDIGRLVFQQTAKDVDYLTKIRKLYKADEAKLSREQERIEEQQLNFRKLITVLLEDPLAATIKVYDVLDNSRTLMEGKSEPADRKRIALYNSRFIVPYAEILGLHNVAAEIADICFEVLDLELDPKSEYVQSLRQGQEDLLGVDENTFIQTVFQSALDIAIDDIAIQKPSIDQIHRAKVNHEIERARLHNRPPEIKRVAFEEDFFLNLAIVLDDLDIKEYVGRDMASKFVTMASDVITRLRNNGEGKFVDRSDGIAGYVAARTQSRRNGSVAYHEFKLMYTEGEGDFASQIPLVIRIYKRSEFDLERTPMCRRWSIISEELPHDRLTYEQQVADKKWTITKKRYASVLKEAGAKDIRDEINEFIHTIPRSITVIGLKDRRGTIIPEENIVPEGATVLDYAKRRIKKSWHQVSEVMVNNQRVSLGYQLKPGDRVHLIFDPRKESRAHPDWFDFISIDAEAASEDIAGAIYARRDTLLEIINNAEAGIGKKMSEIRLNKYKHELEGLRTNILARGKRLLKAQTTFTGKLNLDNVNKLFPNEDPISFLFRAGLNQIDPLTLSAIGNKIQAYWDGLVVVRVRVPDESGMKGKVASAFGSIGLSIIYEEDTSDDLSTGPKTFDFRFDPSDIAINHLDDALDTIYQRLDRNRTFDRDSIVKILNPMKLS